jgi:GNAT superfamily N-acetyltransferase
MNEIELQDITDNQFQLYMNLITNIRSKYEENTFVLDYDWNDYRDYYFRKFTDWKEFKKDRLNILIEGKERSLKEFVIFNSDKPVGFIAYKRLSGNRYEFIFDSECNEPSREVCRKIFEVLNSFFENSDAKQICYLANKTGDIEVFKKCGIEIIENIVTSKLKKEEIDFENLKSIVESNEYAKSLDLKLFRTIPEEIFEKYIDYMNDLLKAKEHHNPEREEFTKYRKEDLLRSIRIDEEDGDPMYMFMLFDKESIAGSCKVYIEREDDGVFIQHCGGLTGVAENYRGKGLAKFLKARMYLKISEDYPGFRHAITDTYPWNKYMYRINEELGFRIFNEGIIFKFTKSNLEKLKNNLL